MLSVLTGTWLDVGKFFGNIVMNYFKKKVCKFEMSHVTPGRVLSAREYKMSTLLKVPLQKHR